MKNNVLINEWMSFARSAFEIAKRGRTTRTIHYEDLCFQAQQAAEKATKAVLIYHKKSFPKTHNIEYLFKLLEEEVKIPASIKKAEDLTDYATTTRYPGDYSPVDRKEYQRALKLAEKVLRWASSIVEKREDELF